MPRAPTAAQFALLIEDNAAHVWFAVLVSCARDSNGARSCSPVLRIALNLRYCVVSLPGCTDRDCAWDHTTFTSENIASLQARMEAETGTSALQHFSDPAASVTAGSTTATATAAHSSSTAGPGACGTGSGGGDQANGAPSKRRLDLGRDEGHTPSPRMKTLKRTARSRFTGTESTPTAENSVGTGR